MGAHESPVDESGFHRRGKLRGGRQEWAVPVLGWGCHVYLSRLSVYRLVVRVFVGFIFHLGLGGFLRFGWVRLLRFLLINPFLIFVLVLVRGFDDLASGDCV